MVAPETEQSAASHSLTVRTPLRVRKLGPRRFAVNGTPTDCVLIAVGQVMADRAPDLVLSGINRGGNLAEDMSYSGTVAAARQAAVMGIRGIAFSQVTRPEHPIKWATSAHFAPGIIRRLASAPWGADVLVNVNFPDCGQGAVTGIEVARQGRRFRREIVTEAFDPFGQPYYWIGSPRREKPRRGSTDLDASLRGAVTVTPLRLDLTDRATARTLAKVFP